MEDLTGINVKDGLFEVGMLKEGRREAEKSGRSASSIDYIVPIAELCHIME